MPDPIRTSQRANLDSIALLYSASNAPIRFAITR